MSKRMKPSRINFEANVLFVVLFAFLSSGLAALAKSSAVIQVGDFSAEKASNRLPDHWEPLYFQSIERHTDYSLVEEDGRVVVKAVADNSASGLKRKITIDPGEYPIIRWRWKVADILQKGNVYQKEGDDYPARLYIAFEYDPGRLGFLEKAKYQLARILRGEYPPLASINYIWASNAPVGLLVPNPYTDRSMMVVVESGAKKVNTWINEERNVYADYRNAFKDEPPMISGVAIMTDTDNTTESATAYYGDIHFHKNGR